MKKKITTPVLEEELKKLRVREIVYLSGDIYTARDKACQRIVEYTGTNSPGTGSEKEIPVPEGAVLYHCGPLIRRKSNGNGNGNVDGDWEIIAAGPTTSSRMEETSQEIIEKLRIRAIIGKGGMGVSTIAAMRKYGCVYLAMIGGAAVLAARCIKPIKAVYWIDLGLAEAVWHLHVEDFGPLIVCIDTSGNSLYEEIAEEARRKVLDLAQTYTHTDDENIDTVYKNG
ncbi:MAG: fumarate hydratase C-terminal domain-containing protein [Methanophagales archaeon]|nr:fumarate hydratase C-terminal domain-containing protein [Methanophagales archaeon]